jgi:hypothetical protein
MDQSHVQSTKRTLRQKRRESTIDPDLSVNFSTEEPNTALLAVKSEKASGFDGVYSEFIKYFGQRTKEWIVALYNDIFNCSSAPNFLRSLSLERMVLVFHTCCRFHCSVSFSRYLNEWSFNESNLWLMQSFLCWHNIKKLVTNANLKRAWYLSISQLCTTPYGGMA